MKYARIIEKIRNASARLEPVSADELRQRSLALRHEAMSGCDLWYLIQSGFPLVVEAARRSMGIVYHDVQLICGIEMSRGRIAEMKTGEGKTVTASLAGYLLSLYGKGLHLVTFNDYLAERDCEINEPLLGLLGQRVSFLKDGISEAERVAAYQCDITYGSAKEFGFDFLRDRLRLMNPGTPLVTRGTQYALIDEADSILIDEARTPLIIAMQDQGETEIANGCFQWASQNVSRFEEGIHFQRESKRTPLQLTAEGVREIRRLPQSEETGMVPMRELNKYIENALRVEHTFKRDKNYAVRGDEVVIIDEFTGRPAEGRQWQDGIHQAVQAKEGVEIAPATLQAGSITIQALFKRYKMFGGMTGTAWTSRRELAKVYKKSTFRIPTNRPVRRMQYPTRVFHDQTSKFQAIAASVQEKLGEGRAILVGTRSISHSEALANAFHEAGLVFDILNAKQLAREGDIVAQAGRKPCVTIATNMAGRGTDIKLSDAVREAGGLHVILTEIHESERIDWQLIGRGSRQGDPGSYQIFLSLTDEILTVGFGRVKAEQLREHYRRLPPARLHTLEPLFRKAQRKTESKQLTDRMAILKQDVEKQRVAFEMGQDPFLSETGD